MRGGFAAPTEGGFSMFSALKFVAAATIVALFGGFLLAGVLTTQQGDDMTPGAVTESPSPMTSVRSDILPGVALTVEEVEPGVFRVGVADDGPGPLSYPVDSNIPNDIVAGHDGGIYVLDPGGYARLGSGASLVAAGDGLDWRLVDAFPPDVGVAPDGTIWAVLGGHLYSTRWNSDHETRHLTTTSQFPIEVTSDGTVWAVWLDDSGSAVFGHLDADGWTMVGEWPSHGEVLVVSDRADVWALACGWGFCKVHRFVDGAWREAEVSRQGGSFELLLADVGVDGTFWGAYREGLIRFDGTEWTTFESPDWSRTDVSMRDVAEAEGGDEPDGLRLWGYPQGEPHVAADGSLWVPTRLGVIHFDPDLGVGHRIVCGDGIDGVARFDGETWSRFLPGRCVEAMDIAADGSVWLLAKESDARFPVAHVYVITPEAVAAKEQ
jgi:hypothetical protein